MPGIFHSSSPAPVAGAHLARRRERVEGSGLMGVCSGAALEVHVKTLAFILDKARRATKGSEMSEKSLLKF